MDKCLEGWITFRSQDMFHHFVKRIY